MKKLLLFCPSISNGHLTKDIVIIPYILQKYFNYDAEIVTLSIDDELIDNKKYLDNLEINLIESIDVLKDKLLDVNLLIMFGIYSWNLEVIKLYKEINPSGKIYLKLDANMYWISNINKDMNTTTYNLLKQCDLISTESRRLQHLLNMIWNLNVQFIPNGYYDFTNNGIVSYEQKEDIIMFAGRVGATEKCNELLLSAFNNIAEKIPNWTLIFVGSVSDDFLVYFNQYLKLNPSLKNRVKLIGRLDKFELKKYYEKSKVFCMTSIIEACANVFSEAIFNGCYIVSTDVDGAIDIIDYGNYGKIVPFNNLELLATALVDICNNEILLKEKCIKSQIYARDNLDWIKLCEKINILLGT